ncbi:unnamed protein product [Strongylus vulgaris]|uniref:HMG box domain-containing protein n=1 Tax=Strongylus vulgaris TaxID=40348 RepID=A0A3P7IYK3_STRVU|nr:unnamed protein product [Strongylus vulgaris]
MSMNPLAIFVKEHFGKNSAKNIEEGQKTMKEAVAAWKTLDSTERKKYEELSKKYREKKMREFDALSDEEKKERISTSVEMKEEKAKRKERRERRENWQRSGHPERPPSAYNLFVQERFTILKNKGEIITPVAKTMRRVSAEWSAMNETAKQARFTHIISLHHPFPYNTKAAKMAEQYKIEVDAWKAKVKPEEKEVQQKSLK